MFNLDNTDIVIVSRFAAALEGLSDAQLMNGVDRIDAYPAREFFDLATREQFLRIDRAALHAERMRRALRVGHGFPQQREAA